MFCNNENQRRWFRNLNRSWELCAGVLTLVLTLFMVFYTNCSGSEEEQLFSSCQSLDFEPQSLKFIHRGEDGEKVTLILDLSTNIASYASYTLDDESVSCSNQPVADLDSLDSLVSILEEELSYCTGSEDEEFDEDDASTYFYLKLKGDGHSLLIEGDLDEKDFVKRMTVDGGIEDLDALLFGIGESICGTL